jgi:hypothetical protein
MLYDSTFYGPKFTIDTLTLNGSTDENGCDWILTQEKGWFGKPAPKQNRIDKAAGRGTFVGTEHIGARVVSLDVRLSAPDTPTLRDAIDTATSICSDPSTLYPLTCTDERGITLVAQSKLDAETLVTPVAWNTVDLSFQFFCPDGRKTSTTATTVTAGLIAAGVGGVKYPVKYPVNYGSPGISGSLVLPNTGNAPADVVFTIQGPVTQPQLVDPSTGNSLTYMGSLASNDQLVINTGTGRVLLNGVDRRSLLSVTKWFSIPKKGTLRLIFSSSNGSDTGVASATYYNTSY